MRTLSIREKYVLLSGGIFLILFFGIRLGIMPVFEQRNRLMRSYTEKQAALMEMQTLQRQFKSLSAEFDARIRVLAGRRQGFSLFSFLDDAARDSLLKNHVAYMTPSSRNIENSPYVRDTVKLKLSEVFLKDLVEFLHQIESSENGVAVTALLLTRAGKDNDRLDAVIETETLVLREKT